MRTYLVLSTGGPPRPPPARPPAAPRARATPARGAGRSGSWASGPEPQGRGRGRSRTRGRRGGRGRGRAPPQAATAADAENQTEADLQTGHGYFSDAVGIGGGTRQLIRCSIRIIVNSCCCEIVLREVRPMLFSALALASVTAFAPARPAPIVFTGSPAVMAAETFAHRSGPGRLAHPGWPRPEHRQGAGVARGTRRQAGEDRGVHRPARGQHAGVGRVPAGALLRRLRPHPAAAAEPDGLRQDEGRQDGQDRLVGPGHVRGRPAPEADRVGLRCLLLRDGRDRQQAVRAPAKK